MSLDFAQLDFISHAILSIPLLALKFERVAIHIKLLSRLNSYLKDLEVGVNWGQLQAALEAHNTLKEIIIVFSGPFVDGTNFIGGGIEVFAEFLETCLPYSYRKGIVRADFLPQ